MNSSPIVGEIDFGILIIENQAMLLPDMSLQDKEEIAGMRASRKDNIFYPFHLMVTGEMDGLSKFRL